MKAVVDPPSQDLRARRKAERPKGRHHRQHWTNQDEALDLKEAGEVTVVPPSHVLGAGREAEKNHWHSLSLE